MYDRMQTFTTEQMTRIHDASMDLLSSVGVAFNEPEALDILSDHGFRVDGKTVFMTESQVRHALDTVPSRFTVTARNPEKSIDLGADDVVFAPGYGAPFIALPTAASGRPPWPTTTTSANWSRRPGSST